MALPSAFDRNLRFCIPVHQRGTFDRAIAALAPGFLEYPVTGEVFQSKVACKTRLQAFALSQGFAVVIGKSNKDGTPFVEFLCVHHGTQSRNDREPLIGCLLAPLTPSLRRRGGRRRLTATPMRQD